ncbi:MAG TPA: hypothetical protein VN770_07005, partial [Gaiellaceae bacterium]|nr:hypothetical protein [Gaiellaceae bacterium]
MSTTPTEAAQPAPPEHGGFRRVLLKLSGEALMGERDYGIDVGVVRSLAAEIAQVQAGGVDVAVVVG